MPAPDVIVIGAGIGGLSAAIRLSAAGKRVLVLERNTRVGGKMSEVTDSGFRFDTGPSVITMRPVLEELFTSVGRRLADYLTLLPVEPLTRYFYPDGSRLDISRALSTTLEQIAALNPRDVEGYLSFLSHAAYLNRITSPVFTYGPPPAPASFLKVHPLDAIRVGLDALQSMDSLIRRHVRHPHLRQLLGRFATY
ncbi:MAG: FAD-dependent oxidoreductase, partial [Anaerolineales bacterium]